MATSPTIPAGSGGVNNRQSQVGSIGGNSILAKDNSVGGTSPDTTNDRDWVKKSFMVDDQSMPDAPNIAIGGRSFMVGDVQLPTKTDIKNRYWSSANAKFTDSRLGCNIGINCRPQITPYSDIRVRGRLEGRKEPSLTETTGNYGMGRYYSEAYDDPAQIIYMRFGVPQFNSLANFMTRAFDMNQSSLVRTGRVPGAFYTAGKLFGSYLSLTAFPVIAVTILAGKAAAALFVRSTSKFYTLKPVMYQYWSTVNMLVQALAVNSGIFPKVMGTNADNSQQLGKPYKIDQDYMNMVSKLMPDIFNGQNHFDIFSIANRAQRVANQVYADDYNKLDQGTASDYTGYLLKESSGDLSHSTKISGKDGSVNFGMLVNMAMMLKSYYKVDGKTSTTIESDPRIDPDSKEGKEKPSHAEAFAEYFDAEFRMGAQFAVFRVDHTGAMSESFSSSLTESDLSQKLNGTSSTFQQARFSLAGGNLIGGVIGETVGAAVNMASDVVGGVASGVTMGAADLVKGLMGDGYIDIPKHWQSSSAQLPETSYTIELVTPYGNVLSWLMNIGIPLSMLLAGALPRSTGKQSYTSPFLCQLFDRGRCQIRLGMITSLSIQRGTGDLAFDTQGRPLAVSVSFKVTDLSSIMHMPVSSGELFDVDMTLDEDNILSDYLAVIAGQDMYSQIYPLAKTRMAVAKIITGVQKLASPAWQAAKVHDVMTSGILSPIGGVIEGLARGAETTAGSS